VTLRAKHGHIVHVSDDARLTRCGKRCDGWIVEPVAVTCRKCIKESVRK
jgi:hypothetical protein